jgi:transcriptional regulator with XRE-family HTH domain
MAYPASIKKLPRREELATFLRTRRQKLTPEQVGLPRGFRRRTPGLRREEVAQLAGVGVTWYTWLEQARDIGVSVHFLERLSNALKLNDAEHRHLFDLCQLPIPRRINAQIEVSEGLKRMVDAVSAPAYLLTTRRWDIVYWNTAVTAVCAPFPTDPNAMELVFLDEHHKSLMRDWEPWARAVVAKFRLDIASVLNEPDVVQLIEKLMHGSAEFRRWWSEPDVLGRDEYTRTYVHPAVGDIIVTPTAFIVEHVPGLRFRVFTPADSAAAEKMRRLVDLWRTQEKVS